MEQIKNIEPLNGFEVIGHIYQTHDYSIFRRLEGNRNIKKSRIEKISESIETVGNLNVPILVNEKFEVLDGQGRISACESLGIPVKFTIQPGVGIDECRMLNAKSTNWSTNDYISSSAELGERWAIFLKNEKENHPGIPIETIWVSLKNVNKRSFGSVTKDIIKGNSFTFADKDYERSSGEIDFIYKFMDIPKKKNLCVRTFASAILYCFRIKAINNERLNRKLHEYYMDIPCLYDISECINYFGEIYNRNSKKKINFLYEYERLIQEGSNND